jgi:hypothetical protein
MELLGAIPSFIDLRSKKYLPSVCLEVIHVAARPILVIQNEEEHLSDDLFKVDISSSLPSERWH